MKVVAYLKTNSTVEFPARDIRNAREIAKRIITEGLWIVEKGSEGMEYEEFYPVHQIFKVKIIKGGQ